MKIKAKFCIGVVFLAIVFTHFVMKSRVRVSHDIALVNIEALADDKEQGGTKITPCAKNLDPDYDGSYYYKCPSGTKQDLIFNCPSSVTRGDKNQFEGNYYCKL